MSAASKTENTSSDRGRTVRHKRSLTLRLMGAITDFIVLLILALLFSIVVEWIGMTLIWSDMGANHSHSMFINELGYLNDSFTHKVMGSRPVTFAIWLSTSIHFWLFEWTRITDAVQWLLSTPTDSSTVRVILSRAMLTINEYYVAATNSTQLFGVRMAVALLSTPAFILFGMAALVDGLVERELRRYGGGNESSFVYHNVKSWMRPAIVGAWFIYLGLPISVHPNLIFVPAALMYGGAIYLTTASFKKYL